MEFTDDPEDEKQDDDQANASEAQANPLISAEVSVLSHLSCQRRELIPK